jgi:hypothetical protein
MSYLRNYLRRELQRIIDAVADPVARQTFSIGADEPTLSATHTVLTDSLAGFLPAKDLTRYLTSESVRESRTVVLLGALNRVDDVYVALDGVADAWKTDSRLITISYNRLWRPLVRSMRLLTGRSTQLENWIPPDELDNLLEQSGFEIIERRTAVLLPIPIIGKLLNRWLAPLPILRLLCVYNIVIARPRRQAKQSEPSVSIIVAARNEEGNIENLVQRLPTLSSHQELIFIEGGSRDDTWGAIQRTIGVINPSGSVVSAHKQTGIGKGDAVRLGFAHATGDILIILDADLSVPPEELPRFIHLLRENSCEFANGSRLVYPMEEQAMQFLNLIGNRLFGITFSYLLGQPVRDTLCGTKALWANDYRRIAHQRSHFGDFDPFGDFDLLFGAARLHLKIRDVPVHYKERVYGSTNISRFRHGLTLLRMTTVAARKLRFV